MISEESEGKVKTMASKRNEKNIKKNNGRFNEGGRGTGSVESRGGALFLLYRE